MTLPPGASLGPYEIVGPLGSGGMGEVFLARDTRLDRSVAIKILPPGLASDAESRQRFEVEARAVSSLNHPHICTLFDVGRHEELDFFVMELLEGQSLADRLVRGPLPFDQVLRTAIEIASALDAAHARGVVHRDLKPSNVMLTKSGAKLLDFGLAKVHRPVDLKGLSTLTADPALTAKGAILGTFHYMAPEQVEGKDVDARADIFAFGAMLYEMATGRRAFEGETQAKLTAGILEREPPPFSTVGIVVPALFDQLVRRCLAKDPDLRWQSARDVLFQLKWIADRHDDLTAAARSDRSRSAWPWGVAAAAALVAIATVAVDLRQAPAEDAPAQLEVSLPEGTIVPNVELRTNIALSPDGRQLAFIALRDGRAQIWLRALDAPDPRPLPGTEGALVVFWSPDSRFVGFGTPGRLRRVDLSGESSQLIAETEFRFETVPSWGRAGTVLFDQRSSGGIEIFRVSENGGPVTKVTALNREANETEHFWPSFLPDGKHFLYFAASFEPNTNTINHAVYAASLDAPGVTTRVAAVSSRMIYAAPGHVLYAREGTVLAQQFDLERRQLVGDPKRVADSVWYVQGTGLAEFSVSDTGRLVFRSRTSESELVWFDRTGKQLGTLGARAAYNSVRISPDGRKVAVDVTSPRTGEGDLWIYDLDTGIPTAFTADRTESIRPVWSGDGLHLFFRSKRVGPPDLYRKRADGRGAKEPVIELEGVQTPDDASPDGRYLAYLQAGGSMDIWLLPLAGPRTPRPYLATAATEGNPRFSPDGRWLAFTSDETGSPEVYVAPLDDPGAKTRVSSAGGIGPRWNRNGREIFYLSLDNTLMAVPLSTGPELRPGVPRPLFNAGPVFRVAGANLLVPSYEVSPDGQRFLVNRMIRDSSGAPITVILNWPALLRKP